jgi:hypothetical protein
MNISFSRVREMKEQRGPRHLVSGRVEGGVYRARYAATASEAERIADEYENEGLKAIEVYAPGDVDSLIRIAEDLGAERRDIKAQEREVTDKLRAACLRLLEQGAAETAVAAAAQVDRMTVRSWQGKR